MQKTILLFMKPTSAIKYTGLRYFKLFLFLSLLFCLQINSACNNSTDDKDPTKSTTETKENVPVLKAPKRSEISLRNPTTTPPEPPTPTPNPTNTAVPVPTSTKLDISVKEILVNSNESMQNLKSFSFRIELNMELIDANSNLIVPFNIEGEFVSPNRSSSIISNPFMGPENSIQTISIGNKFYEKLPGTDGWNITNQANFGDPRNLALGDSGILRLETTSGIKFIREEQILGYDSYKFALDISNSPLNLQLFDLTANNKETSINYWISKDNYYLLKLDVQTSSKIKEGQSILGLPPGDVKINVNIAFTNINDESIIINEPVVKQTNTQGDIKITHKTYLKAPEMIIDNDKSYTAILEMENGSKIEIELYAKDVPMTVNNFVFLASDGYYDNVTFHRVISGFMAQTGDPTGTGSGGPGYRFENEFSPNRLHDGPGILSMANSGIQNGLGTNGSQFFITYTETHYLDGYEDGSPKDCGAPRTSCHSVFGKVTKGMEKVIAITPRDPQTSKSNGVAIKTIKIFENDEPFKVAQAK